MARHAFKFPAEVNQAIRRFVKNAVEGISGERYGQEPNYTAALLGRLEGTVYEGSLGRVVFANTVFDDRGPNSAESRFGADHAITATISDGHTTISKVILVQAKLGAIESLNQRERKFLNEQIIKMKQIVAAPKVMEIPMVEGTRYPAIISGNNLLNEKGYRPMQLADYVVSRITTTLDGCTRPETVEAVKDSRLSRLDIHAKIRRA